MTIKRITREIADLKKEDLGPIVLEPSDDLSIWRGIPSIATQYVRNRKEHDATARQWTHSFAYPKPPIPIVQPQTSKAKGKRRADDSPQVIIGNSGSASRPSRSATSAATTGASTTEIIELDSDSEIEAITRSDPKGKKRKRPSGTGPVNAEEVVDVSDDEDGVGAGASSKRTRTRNPPSTTDRGTTHGEVIVIEDD
ncbi:hypothetical protein JR316_0011603 [Psilocybe cubensis]|uniref:Uncharacterized protein n=1 Tax=Psilocybe cubensis TaxID=181762 RepID=A0ACB8GKA9_PSICU|nr:hypothetical protein JR316_0011603 [Psilocybe cubensis]KAH9476034.1 hypothetical protein JR316_0011603 [Psilocybe cubensis]